jgi:hypothetical protein
VLHGGESCSWVSRAHGVSRAPWEVGSSSPRTESYSATTLYLRKGGRLPETRVRIAIFR